MIRKLILGLLTILLLFCSGFKQAEEDSVSIVMVGDMLMHMPVNRSGLKSDGDIDFSHLFTYTKKFIKEADIAIVNQEVMLG